MMWFMDFLAYLFTEIVDSTEKMSKCCKKAYDKSLAPHHPFVVKTAAQAAWLAAPGRDKFYNVCFGKILVKKKIVS